MTSYGPDLGCCATYPDPPFSLTYGEAFWTVHDPPPITNGIPIASTWTGSALITIGSDGSAARWTPSEGWATIPQVPLLTGLDCTQRLASANGRVVAIVCNEAAVWDELEARWYVIASPESVAWHSNVCELLPGPKGRLEMYVVCTSYLVGNQFIRIDLSAVEATRYSETAVHSQWKLLPNPAATHLDGTTMLGPAPCTTRPQIAGACYRRSPTNSSCSARSETSSTTSSSSWVRIGKRTQPALLRWSVSLTPHCATHGGRSPFCATPQELEGDSSGLAQPSGTARNSPCFCLPNTPPTHHRSPSTARQRTPGATSTAPPPLGGKDRSSPATRSSRT